MTNLTISIFGNQIFSQIISELNLFSKNKIKFHNDFSLNINNNTNENQLIVLFLSEKNMNFLSQIVKNKVPAIVINSTTNNKNIAANEFVEIINMPFKILEFNTKVNSLLARYKFIRGSVINLRGYIIDKNERKIKKDNLTLQLTEKEVNFLVLFSENKKPLTRNFILKNVWNYSADTETHTLETHIHRLRKKILEKFNDNNFIKNNNEGYYI